MHKNSLAAFDEGLKGPFNRRESLILQEIHRAGPGTDREIMQRLGFTEPNQTRPRISALVDRGFLEEFSEKIDPVTKKTVRVVRVRQPSADPQQLPLQLISA